MLAHGRAANGARCLWMVGEADLPVAGFLKLVDSANGLATHERPGGVFFASVGLTAYFIRQAEAAWVDFDTRVNFEPAPRPMWLRS